MDRTRLPPVRQFIAEGPHYDLYCYGEGCPRPHMMINAAQAERLFGAGWTLARIRPRLKCSACGARARDKKVEIKPDTLLDAISRHREHLVKEIAQYGRPQTQPLVLPGLGEITPADLGLKVPSNDA
ncbi:hypothetical protein [Phenylobacterium sp. 58.2.17]|uniref:hypothetical protein n=1 Tax=Phenylobacterium sp. 58.2.17 TaxID=2969306 RepID=UPI002263EF0D|nr:hypothetical protein [Phenylobacterium sp. 58.2.17]MCX7586525.1 hypothetical protein [Phenylobacterium sp. 58.2.17]